MARQFIIALRTSAHTGGIAAVNISHKLWRDLEDVPGEVCEAADTTRA
jgi:hypothetical protein